jgi:hypothetical protein
VGKLGWLIEGLCSVVEGLCRLIEGLCSAVFAVSDLAAFLSGGNLEYFRLFRGISTKERKPAAENSVRFETYAGFRKAPEECLPPFYQFRNCGCANENRFPSGGRPGFHQRHPARLKTTIETQIWIFASDASIWCKVVQNLKGNSMVRKTKGELPTRTSVTIPADIYSSLEIIAKQKRVSMAWVLRDAAERYVSEQWPLFAGARHEQ